MDEVIIPQEFNQQDRIGPFTLPQLAILAGGALISGLLLISGLPLLLGFLLAIPIMGISFYTMVKKQNGIPIYEFAFVYLVYRGIPKLCVYRMGSDGENDFEDDDEEEAVSFEQG